MKKVNPVRHKLIKEIEKIPDENLDDIYNFVHRFRLKVQSRKANINKIMQFAGGWNDMSKEDFNEFLAEIKARREKAFSSRRNREIRVD